jgi:4'-phosphopantetheinyl transferase
MYPYYNMPPSKIELGSDEVHIWFEKLTKSSTKLNEYLLLLSNEERKKIERFHFEKDRMYYQVRHGILRNILSYYIGMDPVHIQFNYSINGKPVLKRDFNQKSIHFNLSHTNGFALYAFTREREIGVDVEYIRNIPHIENVADTFLSKIENDIFCILPKKKKIETFFKEWTQKEAVVKAIGKGLSLDLKKIDVSIIPSEPSKLLKINIDSLEVSRWNIQELNLASGFAAAFAVEGKISRICYWKLPN